METHNAVIKLKERYKMKVLKVIAFAPQGSTEYNSWDGKNIGLQGAQESFKYLL